MSTFKSSWVAWVALALAVLHGGGGAGAQDITAFQNGYLTFTNGNPALYYRVEFRPNLTGPEGWDGTYKGLKNIQTNAPTVTVPVGVFYRIVGSTNPVYGVQGDAAAGDILAGKTAYVNDAELVGTMPNIGGQDFTPGTADQPISAGYHNGAGVVAGDADLATGNIRASVTVFGVTGKTEVADTTSGDAVAAELLSGRKAWVRGVEVTGTMPTQTLSPTTELVQAGYYAATTLSAVDAELTEGNIRKDVVVFGVTGTHEGGGGGYPAPVPKSGAGDLPSYTEVVGEDGHPSMRRGVTWPNPRFTDNENGTVTDNLTGLIWLKNANAFGRRVWTNALDGCATLNSGEQGLTDGSVEGDWRLPSIRELHSLATFGHAQPAICNTAGTGKWVQDDPFTNVAPVFYWSSTTRWGNTNGAAGVDFTYGFIWENHKNVGQRVWPVRGGQ